MTRLLRVALVLLLGNAIAIPAIAQRIDCTYDLCALRVHGGGVAEGIAAHPAEPVVLDSAGGSIRAHYQSYRAGSRYNVPLMLVAAVPYVATVLYYVRFFDRDGEREWRAAPGLGLPVATFGVSWLAQRTASRAEDHLRQSVWLYNGRLARAPDPSDTSCTYERCALRVRSGTWSTRIVAGADAAPVHARDAVDLFTTAADSARVHYDAFREASRQAARGRHIAFVLTVGAASLFAASNENGPRAVSMCLLVLGSTVGHFSWYGEGRAQAELEQAIWFYNRALSSSR